MVLAATASAILPAASPGSSPGEGYRGLRPLHRGARWAWGARGLPQEVRRPLHRSIWVRRERLELSAEVSAAVSALGSGAPVPEPFRIGPTGRRGRERAPRGWGTRGV